MAAATSFAHFGLGQYAEATASAKRAVAQNPRSAIVLRLLAASLAMAGEARGAQQATMPLVGYLYLGSSEESTSVRAPALVLRSADDRAAGRAESSTNQSD